MEYFLVENWKNCVQCLNEYDACGVEWSSIDPVRHMNAWEQPHIFPLHFAGNFWWANSNYIQKLPKDVASHGVIHKAEFGFIGIGHPKVKCFHNSWLNLHEHYYPRENYVVDPQIVLPATSGPS
jgi:hypothetical protein